MGSHISPDNSISFYTLCFTNRTFTETLNRQLADLISSDLGYLFPITQWHSSVKPPSLQKLTWRILCRIEGRAINAAMLFSTCIVKLFKAGMSNITTTAVHSDSRSKESSVLQIKRRFISGHVLWFENSFYVFSPACTALSTQLFAA